MDRNILLVDDQRDILKLLRSTLDTLKNSDIKIFESPSGEEALLESSRHKIDLLVTDYKLPGMTGVQLMHKVRARHPEAKVIIITGMTERKVREEILNAGALATFDKPIPLADFLDVVERGLGLVQTIFPPEKVDQKTEERHLKLSDLLANFRQDIKAEAVFLINDRGLVQARTGKLHDQSMEVSLIATLMSIHAAGLKIAKHNHQESLSSYHIFQGGDHDLLFIPVDPMYALLVAGNNLVTEARVLETVNALLAVRKEVGKSLVSMGVTGEIMKKSAVPAAPVSASSPTPTVPVRAAVKAPDVSSAPPAPEMEALLKGAMDKKPQNAAPTTGVDDFWNQAAEKHAKKPSNSEVISLEEAKKMGLISDDGK